MYTDLSTDKANNVYSAYYIPKIHHYVPSKNQQKPKKCSHKFCRAHLNSIPCQVCHSTANSLVYAHSLVYGPRHALQTHSNLAIWPTTRMLHYILALIQMRHKYIYRFGSLPLIDWAVRRRRVFRIRDCAYILSLSLYQLLDPSSHSRYIIGTAESNTAAIIFAAQSSHGILGESVLCLGVSQHCRDDMLRLKAVRFADARRGWLCCVCICVYVTDSMIWITREFIPL